MSDGMGLAPNSARDPVRALEAALEREQKKVALVQDVSRALSQTDNLDALLALIVAKVTELMDADRATLYLLTVDGRQLWSKVTQGSEQIEIRLDVGEGIAGWVAQTREIVNIPDAYADQRFQPAVDLKSGYRTRSILSVPMMGAPGALSGVLQVLNKQDGPFTHADEELLVALASQAAIAIENARLYHSLVEQNDELMRARRDLERRTRELNALYEVEKELSAALDLDDLLSRILAQAIAVLGGGAGSIALVDADGSMRFRTVQGPAAPRLIERTLPHGTGLLGWSIKHRTPLVVDDPSRDPRHASAIAAEVGVAPQHLMVAPLIDGEDAIGGIEIIDQRRASRDGDGAWNNDDLKLLVLIAAQAAGAISLSRRRSEQSNRDRLASIGQMLAGLLHDLKTPMTIISGYAQLMAAMDDPVQRDKYVEQIQRQFDLMAGMAREVLAFARGDTDLVIRKVYVHRFAEELATQLAAAVAGRGIELEVDARYDGVAHFDEQKLMRVFHNLASNAIEAMPEGGYLRVGIDRDGDLLVWTVRDTGAGIPDHIRGRLFELFATGRKGGTGLGLAIVKKIIDDHHGTIRPETGPSGTTFVIRMPLSRPTDSEPSEAPPEHD
jgi:signal transduction histidine kinase/putative methionine-R-sulfoxide reductase with GAF domain